MNYLSPSSIGLFEKNPEDFYLRYMTKRPREPQTAPMAVGSAFDAYVKAALLGQGVEKLLAEQVEPQWLPEAAAWGQHCFDVYRSCGAFQELLEELAALGSWDVEGDVTAEVHGVPLRGKPDLIGDDFILDWKVNGYFAKRNVSPMKGYVRIRGGKHYGEHHKKIVPYIWRDDIVISDHTLDQCNTDWARQISIYAWLAGFGVGDEFLSAIDQIVCKPGAGRPLLRIAAHRSLVNRVYQLWLLHRIQEIWEIVNSDWFFRDMTKDQSQAREEVLKRTLQMEANFEACL